MSWRKIVDGAMKYGKKANTLAKKTVTKNVTKADPAAKAHADFMRTRAQVNPSIKNDELLSRAEQNIPQVERSWSEIAQEHPYKTAALGGGAGLLGLAALSGGEEEQSLDMTQLIESLRQQGLSDEEIAVYLDNMMQAQGE